MRDRTRSLPVAVMAGLTIAAVVPLASNASVQVRFATYTRR